jgi:serine/threonine protein kinase/formylglycine-generating enzyme required for sulfatase activity
VLGDFRILREVGRGGMGVVYEAEQISLGRRVALKVLPLAATMDPRHLQRFHNEARAAASLHHPHIVPVYAVGQERGVHFYAMQFIDGRTLAQVVRQMQHADFQAGASTVDESGAESPPAPARAPSLTDRQTNRTPPDRVRDVGHFRRVAAWGAEAAEALEHAHSLGIVHRDVKPANLMLDATGVLWVTDFGLAKLDAADGLTMTGDLVGTLRYMSPEQALARHGLVDHRTDVYSLGVTLYELLTLQPAVAGTDRQEIFRQVIQDDPPPPRRLNGSVPAELETVVLKAMAKEPEGRYAAAQELAADLRRFLSDEPIRARRPSLPQRARRWVRRHPALTTGAGVLLLTGVIALGVSTVLVSLAHHETAQALKNAEDARKDRALAQVDALLHADPRAVPALLAGLEPTREDVLPRLRDLWAREEGAQGRVQRGRVALALLPVDPALVKDWLYAWMLEVDDPREFLLLRDALRGHQDGLRDDLWRRAENPATLPAARFRALAALAAFDADEERWGRQGREVMEEPLTVNPLYLDAWAEALGPVRGALLGPLTVAFRGEKLAERRAAATLLAAYAAGRPDLLAELASEADDRQHAALLPPLKAQAATVRPLLQAELAKKAPEQATDAESDQLAFRQANAALTLLHLGEPERVWPLLAHSEDPSLRTYLTHHLRSYGVDAGVLLDRLETETDVSTRRALLLSLGEYAPERVPPARRQELLGRLIRSYRDDPDPGVHGAIEWLLRRWKEEGQLPALRDHTPKGPLKGQPTWYVNGQGQTFAVIPAPGEFRMGAPLSEPDRTPTETPHRRRISRPFAIATKEVTVAEFRCFMKANPKIDPGIFAMGEQPGGFLTKFSPADDGPMVGPNWYLAAAYCNWLSRAEGLPEQEWCYPKDLSAIRPGVLLQDGYLGRKGYRLPTEAEWEYACRAGAGTSRPYGRSAALLGNYGWYAGNSGHRCHPVGSLRPNDLGLFDLLGNAAEWCQNGSNTYPTARQTAAEDAAENELKDAQVRVMRGATFREGAWQLRSAGRYGTLSGTYTDAVGLRVARTLD